MHYTRSTVLLITGAVITLMGLALGAGGIWLAVQGDTWFYALAGLGLIATGILLIQARPAALWLYALLTLGTLGWALWEVGLDWWPLAARGDVIFLFGLFLLTPWITRGLRSAYTSPNSGAPVRRNTAFRGAGLPLTLALALALAVGVVSWFMDPQRIEGTLPQARAQVPDDTLGVPPGEWHAYGRTDHGQRYSPLNQITPANVSNLEVAWTFRTGDIRGKTGRP
jgi:quinoprotein glucose dehydrogenase